MSQPSRQYFALALDPTGYTSISGSELKQMTETAIPYVDHGFIITTTDAGAVVTVPDATTYTDWKRFIWRRVTTTSVKVYAWSPNSVDDFTGTGFQKWLDISAAIGSITNAMIPASTITGDKIITIDWAQLTNIPNLLTNATVAAGDVSGVFGALAIGAAKVTPTMINDLTGAKLVQKSQTVSATQTTIDGSVGAQWIPMDGTVPQTGEGLVINTFSFTPKALTNYLHIRFTCGVVSGDAAAVAANSAIFSSLSASALSASSVYIPATNGRVAASCEWIGLVSSLYGALAPITFKVMCGPGTNATIMYVNKNGTNSVFGGVSQAILSIEEYRT